MIPYNPQGLTPEEVAASRAAHGENIITPQRDDSAWRLLAEKFRDPIIIVLLVAAALSLAMAFMEGNFTETIGILCAILLATCVGFLFEWDAMRRFRRLNRVNDEQPVKVRRGGVMREIPRREVVVGDLVSLEAGETVPADGELVEAVSLQMDESTLTGEPETAKYVDEELFDPEATYPSNRLLRGTTVRDGYGRMVVTAVGDATEAGRVTEQATVQSGEQTPLHRQLTRLSRQIGKVGIALSVLIFVILIGKAFLVEGLADAPWPHVVRIVLNCFMVSVAMIVMAVPEGLPMSITLSLALSMRRMLKTNNLVRKMHACETIGAATVICTDKTGTLTMNRMRVSSMRFAAFPEGKGALLEESIAVNTTGNLSISPDGAAEAVGNPTEGALLLYLHGLGLDFLKLRFAFQLKEQLTFSTERKFMATYGRSAVDDAMVLYVKGAPEILLARSARVLTASGEEELSDAKREELFDELKQYQARGMRTLAICMRRTELPAGADLAEAANELTYLGFAAISDPVRPEVPPAIRSCRTAGIQVKVVTGDSPETAREIGRQIGLAGDGGFGEGEILTGREYAALDDDEAVRIGRKLKIMARARPEDKLKLVRALKRSGEVVAVTGDGTNDAPALNNADVGIAMGKTGTAIAKEAAAIILLDDSFASVVNAVLWGRSLYANIQRFIIFQLTINVAALLIAVTGPFLGVELPLTVIQMLWINLIMDTFAALALATEPPDPAVMDRRPRRSGDFIVTGTMAKNIFGTAIALVVFFIGWLLHMKGEAGAVLLRDQTVFFSVFVLIQFWNLFNVRAYGTAGSFLRRLGGNHMFYLIAGAILAGQIVIVTFGGRAFRVAPLDVLTWVEIIAATSLVLWIGELIRFVARRLAPK